MQRQKLQEIKRNLHKMDFYADKQLVHTLVDTCLAQMNELEGGPGVQAMRDELSERTRQLNLALKDIQALAAESWTAVRPSAADDAAKAVFVAGLPTGDKGNPIPGHTKWDDLGPKAQERYRRMAGAAAPDAVRAAGRVKLAIELAQEMFKSKTTAWRREWAWYLPRLDEEFPDEGA